MAEPKSRYGKPPKITQLANPFAHMEAMGMGKSEEEKRKLAADASRALDQKKRAAASKQAVKKKSWSDYVGGGFHAVGDYARGVMGWRK